MLPKRSYKIIEAQQINMPHTNKPKKKIAPPQAVEAAVYRNIQFTAPYGNPGLIEARNSNTGEKIWEVQVYKQSIDPTLERDVQLRFIEKLEIRGNCLHVTSESGHKYIVDIAQRKVVKSGRGFLAPLANLKEFFGYNI